MKKLIIFIAAIFTVTCSATFALGFGNDFQKKVCHVKDADLATKECKNGEVMLFKPSVFGNEQMPIIISAAFCDYEHPIIYNQGGVSCIFTDKRKEDWDGLEDSFYKMNFNQDWFLPTKAQDSSQMIILTTF